MLIDINAYVGHWPFMQLKHNTCDALHERMNKFGVDISVISNLNGIFYKNTQSANEELFGEIKSKAKFRDRFIPFAVINPIYAGWRDDLDFCINKFGFKGVRIYPKYHDFEILDPACIELVKRVRDYGLPVAFNFRMVDSRQRSWIDTAYVKDNVIREWNFKNILPIIKAVPDAKYMILNFANAAALNAEEMTLVKNADLLFDTSGRTITNMSDFLKIYGFDKFAFGTHSPILDYLTGLLRIESLGQEEADDALKEMLRFGNAKKILSI
ncbi:MAG: amidohydrolase family protein [Daejeonella sp.]|uniref:amidohydrolase family protein n=1 Tax=Daejeonella sp. TaxID=2805397 RepID=UPI002735D66E|nr:amidohydrolase family protein [Daejeonella sp.]MDP3468417.1 amidohydrolase family protein [Daejeonella sp.]